MPACTWFLDYYYPHHLLTLEMYPGSHTSRMASMAINRDSVDFFFIFGPHGLCSKNRRDSKTVLLTPHTDLWVTFGSWPLWFNLIYLYMFLLSLNAMLYTPHQWSTMGATNPSHFFQVYLPPLSSIVTQTQTHTLFLSLSLSLQVVLAAFPIIYHFSNIQPLILLSSIYK